MKQILLAVIPNRVIFHFTTFENRVGKYFVKKGYRKSDLLLKLSDKHAKDIYNYTVEPNLSSNMFDSIKENRSRQYLNVGTCEQSMVGIAAGLAIEGFLPIVYTITPFLLERAFEQIKLDIDHQQLKVILVGFDDYPKDGPTHRPISVYAMASLLRNTLVLEPTSKQSCEEAVDKALKRKLPSFIHLRNAPSEVRNFWPAEGREA